MKALNKIEVYSFKASGDVLMKTDILIIGSGCAGMYCALNLPKNKNILIITKSKVEESDSFLAQGGMCMLKDESDYESYFEDTMKAGHYENDKKSVEIMIRSSSQIVNDLINYGVEFHREAGGALSFTREGAHSSPRIVYYEDITGKEITSKLWDRVKERKNITILEHCAMLDIICQNNKCYGIVAKLPDSSIGTITANTTVFACGGIGGLYRFSTNFRQLTGDALAVAMRHGIKIKNINYVQVHPTTLYSEKPEDRSFLISESVRGEGAVLYNKNKERFVNELLPRDLLTEEIRKQMKKDGTNFVWLDMSVVPKKELENHFPNIVAHCKSKGYDVYHECIPVVPAQHYFMGGVQVDYESKTSMNQLYAIGETACNGVHGKNRLASNSLLESLVFAKRAAKRIAEEFKNTQVKEAEEFHLNLRFYQDEKSIADENKKLILDEIERLNRKNEQ